MDQLQAKLDLWNKNLEKVGPIKALVQQTKLPAITFVAVPVVILLLAIALDLGASLCTTTIGVIYPTL